MQAAEPAAHVQDGVRDNVAKTLEEERMRQEVRDNPAHEISVRPLRAAPSSDAHPKAHMPSPREMGAQFDAFMEAARAHGIEIPEEQRAAIQAEAAVIARRHKEEGGNFFVRYVRQIKEELLSPIGSHMWLKGLVAILALATYLYVVPKWGYGGVLKRIREKEPSDTRAFLVFAWASALAATNSTLDDSFVTAACLSMLTTYAVYTAVFNNRLRRQIETERSKAVDESGINWSAEDAVYEFHACIGPCALWTKSGRVRRWSKGMEDLLGYTEQEMQECADPLRKLYGYDPDELERASVNVEELFSKVDVSETGTGRIEPMQYVRVFHPMAKGGDVVSLRYHTLALEERGKDPDGKREIKTKGRLSLALPAKANDTASHLAQIQKKSPDA